MENELLMFQQQIGEDIGLIQNDLMYIDPNLNKNEYAFNYWVLSRIFSIDDELIPELITEYSDKGVDCYVHYEDSKELYIIQNKFHAYENPVPRPEVTDFLKTPLDLLRANRYSKSDSLQNAFNRAKDDSEYKIYFYLFATTKEESLDIKQSFSSFNNDEHDVSCYIEAKYFSLQGIYELYYGRNYKENIQFTHPLGTLNKGTFASIREEYQMTDLYEAYYIVTPIYELYKMLVAANEKGYSIFEKNIREYLGPNPVNNGIVETLKSKSERKNFLYYNNGVTIVCQKMKSSYTDTSKNLRVLPLVNPQIVNGCQTVNSIKAVLENLSKSEIESGYKNVYVMVKALVVDDMNNEKNKSFSQNVVKYTNKQNAISDKVFASDIDTYQRLQIEFEKRGFLLLVKPSDKNTYKTQLNKTSQANLIQKANITIRNLGIQVANFTDLCIPLEKLLQVFLAFMRSGQFAFTKKSEVLKQNGEIFENYSSRIQDYLSFDTMIQLYFLYKKSEQERLSPGSDKRSPISYYVIGFLGELIGEKSSTNIREKLDYIFGNPHIFSEAYKYLTKLTKRYKKTYEKDKSPGDYNTMIKRPIENSILKYAVELNNDDDWTYVSNWSNNLS